MDMYFNGAFMHNDAVFLLWFFLKNLLIKVVFTLPTCKVAWIFVHYRVLAYWPIKTTLYITSQSDEPIISL